MGPSVASLALLGAILVTALAVRAARLLDTVEVRGRSMAPTLLPGDRLIVVRLRRRPVPGEVVLAGDPRDRSRELVKRVHAIGRGGVEVRGDNPAFSTDARTFGAIPHGTVRWRILARIWPARRVGRIGRPRRGAVLDEGVEPACPVPEHPPAG